MSSKQIKKYIIFIIFISLFLMAFDSIPSWNLSKVKFPDNENEWLAWFLYPDYRCPTFARKHFVGLGENALSYILPCLNSQDEIYKFYIINFISQSISSYFNKWSFYKIHSNICFVLL